MACQYFLTALAHLDTPAEELQQEWQKTSETTKKSMQAEHIHRQHAILAETNCSALIPSNSSCCFPCFKSGPGHSALHPEAANLTSVAAPFLTQQCVPAKKQECTFYTSRATDIHAVQRTIQKVPVGYKSIVVTDKNRYYCCLGMSILPTKV